MATKKTDTATENFFFYDAIADAAEAAKLAADEAAEAERLAKEESDAAAAAELEAAEALKKKGLDDPEKAKLLKDLMKNKGRAKLAEENLAKATTDLAALKELIGDDLTPEKLKELLDSASKAEEDKAKAAGDWDKLKERLVHTHSTELGKLKKLHGDESDGLKTKLEGAEGQIRKLLVSNSFAASKFLADNLILTSAKAERLFGEHFKVEAKEDGTRSVTAYLDGEPLVDSEGKSLPFEKALEEIVNRDPEKETLFKAKAKLGSGSGKDTNGAAIIPVEKPRGVAAIKVGLDSKKTT